MADDTSTETGNADTSVTEGAQAGSAAEQSQASDVPPEVKRALNKANREAEALRLRLKEFEDRDKTELQKYEERATSAEQRLAPLEVENAKLSIALEKGLTASQARRLVGATREEIEADAEQLVADLGITEARPRVPGPNRAQGSSSNGAGLTPNDHMNALIRSART